MTDLLSACSAFFRERRADAYLVGGTVRDQLLGRESHDLDFAVPRDALAVARELANALGGAYYPLDAERETGRIVMSDRSIVDVALIRGATIEADLAARDFTINAMARRMDGGDALIDPHHGAADTQARRIRAVGDEAFRQDPVRLIRAVRLSVELGFDIVPQTLALILRDAPLLSRVAGERVRDELAKMLNLRRCSDALRLLAANQLHAHVIPNAVLAEDVYARLAQLESLYAAAAHTGQFAALLQAELGFILSADRPRLVLLKLAMLYQGNVGGTRSDLQRLHFSRHEIEFAVALARHWRRFAQVSPPADALAAHRFFRDTGAAGVSLIALALSDPSEAQRFATADKFLHYYVEAYDRVIAPQPLLSGREIAERFGARGSQIKQALTQLIEAQVSGIVQTRADAERYLGERLNAPP